VEKSLLEAYLKRLRLPAISRHYQELVRPDRPGESCLRGVPVGPGGNRSPTARGERPPEAAPNGPVSRSQELGPVRLHGVARPQQSPGPGSG
jgi:hypothetical protein